MPGTGLGKVMVTKIKNRRCICPSIAENEGISYKVKSNDSSKKCTNHISVGSSRRDYFFGKSEITLGGDSICTES